jgi:hypothetical protein
METSNFPHRHNSDGTVDSICVKCFSTIATDRDETALREFEQHHVCDPNRLSEETLACAGLASIHQMGRVITFDLDKGMHDQ